jgi:uncharacterized damage-inducible protein DinB
MTKPDLSTIPVFYHRYVQLIQEENVRQALSANTEKTFPFLTKIPQEKWDYRYEEGKWSVKEMVQHLIDSERIFCYRALCIARGEKVSLPGFDENTYAAASEADRRSKEDLLKEFDVVRQSTQLLFASFTNEQLQQTGIANQKPVSVTAIGFITAGHVAHHLGVLRERYGV